MLEEGYRWLEAHGDCRVPITYVPDDGHTLGASGGRTTARAEGVAGVAARGEVSAVKSLSMFIMHNLVGHQTHIYI